MHDHISVPAEPVDRAGRLAFGFGAFAQRLDLGDRIERPADHDQWPAQLDQQEHAHGDGRRQAQAQRDQDREYRGDGEGTQRGAGHGVREALAPHPRVLFPRTLVGHLEGVAGPVPRVASERASERAPGRALRRTRHRVHHGS